MELATARRCFRMEVERPRHMELTSYFAEKRTGDGDFGPVQVVQNKNGKLEFLHTSSESPHRVYRFVETHRNLTHTYFKCVGCIERT